MTTTIENKIAILADLWLNYKDDEDFEDFIQYNDLGLPLAYAINENVVEKSEMAINFIEETFALLLAGLELPDDSEYLTLDDLLYEAGDKSPNAE
jgi:hypothetical protein